MRSSISGRMFLASLLLLSCVQIAFAQSADLLAQFKKGPHTGPAEDAVALIEVINLDKDGKPMPVRRANAALIRCDGFLLAPADLFIRLRRVKDKLLDQFAAKASVTVTLNPGTKNQKSLTAHVPRWLPDGLDYTALKIDGIHKPAVQVFQPDVLKPGDKVEVLYCPLGPSKTTERTVERRFAELAQPAAADAKLPIGWIEFKEPITDVPEGALVVGPHDQAFGMVATSKAGMSVRGFTSFSILHLATNCVSANPSAKRLAPEATAVGGDKDPGIGSVMVLVSGGPVAIPNGVLARQPDMEDIEIACIGPFQIDKYEVTNREYLAFWNALPAEPRKTNSRLFPIGWATTDPPFPKNLENTPVLGV